MILAGPPGPGPVRQDSGSQAVSGRAASESVLGTARWASRLTFGHNGSDACVGWADPEWQVAGTSACLVSCSEGARRGISGARWKSRTGQDASDPSDHSSHQNPAQCDKRGGHPLCRPGGCPDPGLAEVDNRDQLVGGIQHGLVMRVLSRIEGSRPVEGEIYAPSRKEDHQPGECAVGHVPVAHEPVKCVAEDLAEKAELCAAAALFGEQHLARFPVVTKPSV